jgi:hypothetical protein
MEDWIERKWRFRGPDWRIIAPHLERTYCLYKGKPPYHTKLALPKSGACENQTTTFYTNVVDDM